MGVEDLLQKYERLLTGGARPGRLAREVAKRTFVFHARVCLRRNVEQRAVLAASDPFGEGGVSMHLPKVCRTMHLDMHSSQPNTARGSNDVDGCRARDAG